MALLKKLFRIKTDFKREQRDRRASRLVSILKKHAVDCVLDAGANTGQTAEELRGAGYRGKIISFEPVKHCHDELVAKSAADANWSIAPRCALGDKEGTVEFQISEGSSLSSINAPTEALRQAFPSVRAASTETISIHRLDRLMKQELEVYGRVFLKVDTQGTDMQVLKGTEGLMDSLIGIKVEMSLLPLYEHETLYLDMLNFLHQRGFSPHLLFDVGYSGKLSRQLQIDGAFIRNG